MESAVFLNVLAAYSVLGALGGTTENALLAGILARVVDTKIVASLLQVSLCWDELQ